MGPYGTNIFMVSVFYFSDTILNISELWEIKNVYCNPRAITKIIKISIAISCKIK